MSEINRQAEPSVDGAEVLVSNSHPVASPSRRRIIRLGASAVPVLATLTSQSALAGACITTSAWGSDQISNSKSQATRHADKAVQVTTGWKISAWNSAAQGSGTPWFEFKKIYGGNPNTLTFAQLFALVGTLLMRNPTSYGFNGMDLVADPNHLTSDDKGYFLVAQLNYAIGAKPPVECVTDVNWLAIVAGNYPLANPWDLGQIALYIKNNFIVQA